MKETVWLSPKGELLVIKQMGIWSTIGESAGHDLIKLLDEAMASAGFEMLGEL